MFADLDQIVERWLPEKLPGELVNNTVETKRMKKRIYGGTAMSRTNDSALRLRAIQEILRNVAYGLGPFFEGKWDIENLLQEIGDGEEEKYDQYCWHPFHLLCERCFSRQWHAFQLAWWVRERNSDRVKGTLHTTYSRSRLIYS
jgi:hypothetical protein